MKVQRSINIDYEVNKKLQDNPQINVSSLCNKFLKKYIKENNIK